ncbi:MAG: response regulator [Phycisphaeraceae bacterium]|nr:response regulator [Phycisphaeraceae bacterium]
MSIRRYNANAIPSKAGRPNTVNLEQRALEELLDELDERSGASDASKRRDFVRWPFRQTSIRMHITQARGMSSDLEVACRNLSCGGASVLHSSYVHLGSKVRLVLPNPTGGTNSIEGTVCRCQHVRGVIHEIGIKFAKRIEARDYLRTDGQSNRFSLERVDPDRLQGTVVHIDDSPMDRRLVQHYLRGTQLRLRQTDDADEALRWLNEGCDLALVDADLGPGRPDGIAFLKRARAGGFSSPTVLLAADIDASRAASNESLAEATLSKPLAQDVLLRAIAEYLLLGGGAGPMYPSLPRDHPNLALLDGFLGDLKTTAGALQAAIEQNDFSRARSLCSSIMGTAPAMGYAGLAASAEQAALALTKTGSVREAQPMIRSLIAACDRVRPPQQHAA